MAAYARDLISYKYHVDSDGGRRDILDRLLVDDKRKQPSRLAPADDDSIVSTSRPQHYSMLLTIDSNGIGGCQIMISITIISWWRGTVVERRSVAGELSLSCARPAADG